MSNNNGQSIALRVFRYIPEIVPTAVALSLYGVVAIYLTVRIYISKSPKFLYILAFTALMEVIGFAVQIMCHFYTDLGRFVTMTLFLLLASNALALVKYKTVGEIIRPLNVETTKFYFRPKFVTCFFFSSDIFAFCLQGGGAGLQTTDNYAYAAITVYVHRNSKYQYYVEGEPNAKKSLILCLYITTALIYIRSIYRVAEYATGFGGPIARLKWAFYVFDTIVIFLSFIIYISQNILLFLKSLVATLAQSAKPDWGIWSPLFW